MNRSTLPFQSFLLLTGLIFGSLTASSTSTSVASPVSEEEKPIWSESFEGPTKEIKSYPVEAPEALHYEYDEEQGGYLRIVAAGGNVAGITIQQNDLPDNSLLRVTAKVRGDGAFMATLSSRNGKIYGPPIALDAEWQEMTVSKAVGFDDTAMMIYLHRPPDAGAGGVIEIGAINLYVEPSLEVQDVAVPPQRFEAADYPKSQQEVVFGDGYRGVGGLEPFVVAGVPVPMTARPLTLYVKVRPGSTADVYDLCGRRMGISQSIRVASPTGSGDWEWLRFLNLSTQETGETVNLQALVKAGAVEPAVITDFIWSTDSSLTPVQLDALLP